MSGPAIPLNVLVKTVAALEAVHSRTVGKPLPVKVAFDCADALGALRHHVNLQLAMAPAVEVAA